MATQVGLQAGVVRPELETTERGDELRRPFVARGEEFAQQFLHLVIERLHVGTGPEGHPRPVLLDLLNRQQTART